ncbi:MAG: outer membrane protein assembly factor BamE [Gammaproteobacteria bacterium]|nr:outer membrane protein assembly factor BamE [Gammaproteobacteria bacterium]
MLSSCSYFSSYHFDIQQGNVIEQSQVNKLRMGMKKEQVQFILGNPLLKDMFHINRWDFYYSLIDENLKTTTSQMTLFFNETGLYKIDGDYKVNENAPVEQKQQSFIVGEKHYEEPSKWYETIFWWNARKDN